MENFDHDKISKNINEYLDYFKIQDNFFKKCPKKSHPIELRKIIREITKEINGFTNYTKKLDEKYENNTNDKNPNKNNKKEKKTIKCNDSNNSDDNDEKMDKFDKSSDLDDLFQKKPKKNASKEEIESFKENVFLKLNKLKNMRKSVDKHDIKTITKIDKQIKEYNEFYMHFDLFYPK